jgi:protein tyrosine/serine phosphatase
MLELIMVKILSKNITYHNLKDNLIELEVSKINRRYLFRYDTDADAQRAYAQIIQDMAHKSHVVIDISPSVSYKINE